MFRPRVVGSITNASARLLMVNGPPAFSFARIENCVIRSPEGARC